MNCIRGGSIGKGENHWCGGEVSYSDRKPDKVEPGPCVWETSRWLLFRVCWKFKTTQAQLMLLHWGVPRLSSAQA